MVPENNTPSVVATSDRPSVAWSSVVLSTLTFYQNTGHCRLRYYPPRARPNVCVKGKGISRDSREFIINASVSRDSTNMASPTAPVDGQKCSRPLHTVSICTLVHVQRWPSALDSKRLRPDSSAAAQDTPQEVRPAEFSAKFSTAATAASDFSVHPSAPPEC